MSRRDRIVLVVIWVVSVVGAALVVYELKGTTVTVETGRAYVGIGQATAFVDGYGYDIPITDTIWENADGSFQFGGSDPECLANQESMSAPFTFGWVPVTEPNGSTIRQVVWVSCAG